MIDPDKSTTGLKKQVLFLFLFLAFLLSSHAGEAATDRFPAFDIWPAVGDRYYFSLPSSQGLYQLQYSFDLSNAYLLRPLDVVSADGTRLRSVIDSNFAHFISAGLGFTDFWQFGVTVPLFSRARFEEPLADPSPGAKNIFEVGDVRLTTKIRFLNSNRYRFGIALEPFVTIPLGADTHYLGDSSITGGGKAVVDFLATRRIRLTLNVGTELRENVTISNIDFGHRFLSGFGASLGLTPRLTFSLEAQANTAFKSFFTDRDTTPIQFLGGLHWDVGETGLNIGAGGGSCGICGGRAEKVRAFLNVGYRRMNASYALKQHKEGEMRVVVLGGTPETFAPYEIYELSDKCPLESSDYDVTRDDPRCTEIYELKALAEECPEERDFNRHEDNPKCLQVYTLRTYDSDQDLVPDFIDQCPTEYGDKKNNGCSDTAYIIVSPEEGEIITKSIHFEFGKAVLSPEAEPILEVLAGALHAQPAIKKLSIEGHTDDVGLKETNQALSVARAKTVYKYLLDHGINPSRLTYKGYGKKYPLTFDTSEEGRARNRRVEFIIEKVEAF